MTEICTWTLIDGDANVWAAGCYGNRWQLEDGGPRENGMAFCPFCGKELVVGMREAEPGAADTDAEG
jgi:hypothetical protein